MSIVVQKWSEGLYAAFLEKQEKNNVTVSPWKTGNYTGNWCGEAYTEERAVTFNFLKQTIGKTLVEVTHTQQCRRSDDRCVVQIKIAMKGKPRIIMSFLT